MQQYEYLVAEHFDVGHTVKDVESRLNKLGAQGWELTTTVPDIDSHQPRYIFKRVKSPGAKTL